MEQSSSDTGICVICNESLDSGETSILTEKGKVGIEKAAEERNETILIKEGERIHTDCRKRYTNSRNIALKRKERNEGTNIFDLATLTFDLDVAILKKAFKLDHYF